MGSIEEPRLQNFLELLTALAGHEPAPINIHEMTMRCEGTSRQEIQLRHLIIPTDASDGNGNGTSSTISSSSSQADRWAVYQYNVPPWCDLKTKAKLAATVLTVTQAYCSGPDVPNFYKGLGFVQQYQHFKKGFAFDVQRGTWAVHILVSRLHRVIENNAANGATNGGRAATAAGGSSLHRTAENGGREVTAGEEVAPGHVLVEVWTEVDAGKTHTDAIAALVEVGKQLAVEGVVLQPLPEKKNQPRGGVPMQH